MIHGRNLRVTLNGITIAGCKSCSMDSSTSFLPTSSPSNGRWETCLPDRNSWKITADALLTNAAGFMVLQNAYHAQTELTVRYYDETFGINLTGKVYIERLNSNGSVGSLGRYSVSLRGNGSLSNYSGETISPRVLVQSLGWYYDDTGQDSFDPIDDENSMVRGLQFTLTEDATVRVIPGDVTVLFGTSSLITAIQDKEYIQYGQEYDNVIITTTDVQLTAGTYYLCYNFKDDTADDPVLINLTH